MSSLDCETLRELAEERVHRRLDFSVDELAFYPTVGDVVREAITAVSEYLQSLEVTPTTIAASVERNARILVALAENDGPVESDPGEHVCDDSDSYFDREVCPDPCGKMHYRCRVCGAQLDECASAAPLPDNEREALAHEAAMVAGWLRDCNVAHAEEIGRYVASMMASRRTPGVVAGRCRLCGGEVFEGTAAEVVEWLDTPEPDTMHDTRRNHE